jgi:hypothetical protein
MKIVIVGPQSDPTSFHFYDKTWEMWGINSAHRRLSLPWTRMFNLHRYAHLERDCPEYVDWDVAFSRRNPKVPMVVVDRWHGLLENEVILPRAELSKQPRGDYHASSFDWMVAYAVHLKAKAIYVHGCQFALDSPRHEPISARACLEYWIGYAQGRGIDTDTAWDCDILKQYHLVVSNSVYGYDDIVMVENRTGKRYPRIG